MRVVSCMIVLAMLCTTSTGCSLFKKNTNGTSGTGNGTAPVKFPGNGGAKPDPLLNHEPPPPPTFPPAGNGGVVPTSASKNTGILAGTVCDAYQRHIGNAYIRLVNLDEKESGAPIDVVADSNGIFLIQGVKPGVSYKLIARTKINDKMLAGTALIIAPNVRVVIPISEDLVNASTPPLPSAPAYQSPADPAKKTETSNNTDTTPFGTAWNTGQPTKPVIKPPLANEPNLPATMIVPAPPTSTPVANPPAPSGSNGDPTFVPGIADTHKDMDRPPTMNWGPSKKNQPLPPLSQPDLPRTPIKVPGDAKLDTGPTLVPSCVRLANRLENMALRDTKGQVWEYRKHGQGKLILLDFWGTHCVHCRKSMPTLNQWQNQYGSRGFEVIGIALEYGTDDRKEAQNVSKHCIAMKITYRQLLGRVGSFDAGKQFYIEGIPTLILLDERGDIIWQYKGATDANTLGKLENVIDSHLKNKSL